jgi:hypothetical protein
MSYWRDQTLSGLIGTLNQERWRACFGPHHEQQNLFLEISGETGIQPIEVIGGISADFRYLGLETLYIGRWVQGEVCRV